MVASIDLKDRKILYELDKNARISYAKLGKLVGLSTESVHYRVKRLEEQGIIKQYQTVVNYSKLGLIHAKVCLRFNGMDLKTQNSLYEKLNKIPQIVWIAECKGDFDCILSITVNNLLELDKIKDKVISISNKYIDQKTVSISSEIWSYPRDYLLDKKRSQIFRQGGNEVLIDTTDLKLLRILSNNARKPVVDIVKEMNSTVKIVTGRTKKLLKKGVINNFRAVLNYKKLGIHFYKTFFYLKNPDEKRLKELMDYLDSNTNVIHNLKVIGSWDLEPEFEFFDPQEFEETLSYLQDNFSDIIKRISIIEIAKEYKYTFFYK
jgi:DNA-binding Lrp family transcriptional regulator